MLFALIITSSLTSLDSYRTTNQMVCKDMDRALALALEEQQSDVDTIQTLKLSQTAASRIGWKSDR